jgi:hypothetical protein
MKLTNPPIFIGKSVDQAKLYAQAFAEKHGLAELPPSVSREQVRQLFRTISGRRVYLVGEIFEQHWFPELKRTLELRQCTLTFVMELDQLP